MSTVDIPDEVFEIGILNREYHDRLIADLKRFANKAGIPPEFVWSKMSKYCTDEDMNWVRKMREGKDNGLVYVGSGFDVPVEDKMMAIAGACLRNYIDAQVMSVQDVLLRLKNDNMPNCTVCLVPNFAMSNLDSQSVASWQTAHLLGWLYSRMAKNLKTVLYVGSMDSLNQGYGESMVKHIKTHYTLLS